MNMTQYVQYQKLSFSTWLVFVFLFFYYQDCLCIGRNKEYNRLETINENWIENDFSAKNKKEERLHDLTPYLRPQQISSVSFGETSDSGRHGGTPTVSNAPPKPPRTMAYKPPKGSDDTDIDEYKRNMDKLFKGIFDPIDNFARKLKALNTNFLKMKLPECFAKVEPLCVHSAYNKATEYKDSQQTEAFLPLTKLEVDRVSNKLKFYNHAYLCLTVFCNSLPASYVRFESEACARDLRTIYSSIFSMNLEDKYIFFDIKNFMIKFISGGEKMDIIDGRALLASLIWFKKSQLGNLCLPYVQAERKNSKEHDMRKEFKVEFRYNNPIHHPVEYFRSGSLHCFDTNVNEKTPITQNKLSVSMPINLKTIPYIHLADAAIEMVTCLPNKYIDVFIPGTEKSFIKKILTPLSASGPVYNAIKANKIMRDWAKNCPKLTVLSSSKDLLVLDQFNIEVLSVTFPLAKNEARLFGRITKDPFLQVSTEEASRVESRKKVSMYSKKFLEYLYTSKPVLGHVTIRGKKSFNVGNAVRQHAVVPITFVLKGVVQGNRLRFDGC